MREGVVVAVFPKSEYGFIRPKGSTLDRSQDLYVRFEDVRVHPTHGVNDKYLMVGEEVTYEVIDGQPRQKAVNVNLQSERRGVRADIIGISGSHVRTRFPWGRIGTRTASVNRMQISGTQDRHPFNLRLGDEIVGVAYATASGEIRLGSCIIPPR